MKRFLSLLLAIVMVVSLVPMLIVSVGAEEPAATVPDLVITEVIPAPPKYSDNIATWKREIPAFFSSMAQNDASSVGRVFRFLEIYNGGETAVDLYDYQLAFDSDAAVDGTTITFADFKAGEIEASKKTGGYYERVAVEAYTSVTGYYTYADGTYTAIVDTAALAQPGQAYYTYIPDDVTFVTNPTTALLQPGECALIWFYTADDGKAGATVDQFKGYYEWRYSYSKTNYAYGVDLSDTLVIAVEGFSPASEGSVYYGIAKDTVVSTNDTDRDQWESRAKWNKVGFVYATSTSVTFAKTVTVGTTNVCDGMTYVKHETGAYYLPSLETGTADENGLAVEGVDYVTFKLSVIGNGNYSNSGADIGVSFLYGYDTTKPLCEGFPYASGMTDLTPGLLTAVQAATLPAPGVEADKPELVISEVAHRTAKTDKYAQNALPFIEVTNVSDKAVNIYEYSLLLNVDPYNLTRNEYFSKIHTLIPGDVGNIYAATPDSSQFGYDLYEYDLYNPVYAEGWLMPGESAALWGCTTSEVPNSGLTFKDFYSYYDLDESVKVFAYDADPTYVSYHQHLKNGATYFMVGLAKSEKIGWTGEEYLSPPVISAISVLEGGVASTTKLGVSLANCESFALCNPTTTVGFAAYDAALPLNYAFQFVADGASKLSSPLGIFQVTMFHSDNDYSLSEAPILSDHEPTPGTLTAAQKEKASTATEEKSLYVLYMQDYNKIKNTTDTATVLAKTAMTAIGDTTAALSITDGKMTVANSGTAEEKWQILDTAMAGKPLVVTYDVSFGTGESLVEKSVVIKVNKEGVTTITVNGETATDLTDSYVSVDSTNDQIVLVTAAGVTATYDQITVYVEEEVTIADEFFYTIGELATGEQVWLHQDVVGGYLTDSFLTILSGTVTAEIGEETTVSFTASVDRDYVNDLEDIFDVSVAMLVYRTDDLGAVGALTPEAFAAGVAAENYLYQTDMTGTRLGGNYEYYSEAFGLAENHYSDSFGAVAMVSAETTLGTVTCYSEPSEGITATQVLADALQDTSDTPSDEYCYDMGDGTWARYSSAQMKAFAKICKKAI